jgi:hypothetical protein
MHVFYIVIIAFGFFSLGWFVGLLTRPGGQRPTLFDRFSDAIESPAPPSVASAESPSSQVYDLDLDWYPSEGYPGCDIY